MLSLAAFASEHEIRLAAHRHPGLKIPQRIAHRGHAGQIGVVTRRDFAQQTGLGLAAFAGGIRRMRAEKNRIDSRAHIGASLDHFFVDGIERVHLEQPAAHTGLIGGHHHAVAPLIQSRDRFQAAGNGLPFLGGFDELRRVMIDHAIAVEDDEFHLGHFRLSIPWLRGWGRRPAGRCLAGWVLCATRVSRESVPAAGSLFLFAQEK